MIHAEFTYLELGRRLEEAPSFKHFEAVMSDIHTKVEAEHADERNNAYYLIERGRKEIRETRR